MDIKKVINLLTKFTLMDIKKRWFDIVFFSIAFSALLISINLFFFAMWGSNEQINQKNEFREMTLEVSIEEFDTKVQNLLNDQSFIQEYSVIEYEDKRTVSIHLLLYDYRFTNQVLEKVNSLYKDINVILPKSIELDFMKSIRLLVCSFMIITVAANIFILIMVVNSTCENMSNISSLLSIIGYKNKVTFLLIYLKVLLYEFVAILLSYVVNIYTMKWFVGLSSAKIDVLKRYGMNQYLSQNNWFYPLSVFVIVMLFTYFYLKHRVKRYNNALALGVEIELS